MAELRTACAWLGCVTPGTAILKVHLSHLVLGHLVVPTFFAGTWVSGWVRAYVWPCAFGHARFFTRYLVDLGSWISFVEVCVEFVCEIHSPGDLAHSVCAWAHAWICLFARPTRSTPSETSKFLFIRLIWRTQIDFFPFLDLHSYFEFNYNQPWCFVQCYWYS